MPWISLPYDDPRIHKYATNFNIKGIPMLIVIREDLTVATMDAKLDVLKCLKE